MRSHRRAVYSLITALSAASRLRRGVICGRIGMFYRAACRMGFVIVRAIVDAGTAARIGSVHGSEDLSWRCETNGCSRMGVGRVSALQSVESPRALKP